MIVDVASGQTKELRTLQDDNPEWVLDNDVVLLTETANGDAAPRHASVWQIDLTGQATLLREIPTEPGATLTVLNRTRALVVRNNPAEVRVVPLTANGQERLLLSPGSGFIYPRPTLSTDRRWVLFRLAPTGGDNTRLTTLELVRISDDVHRRVELPFVAEAGPSVAVARDASAVIVAERRRQDQAPGVYRVDVGTSSATKLFTYSANGRSPEVALSADGRTLLYLMTETPPPAISAIDIAGIASRSAK